MFPMTYFLAKSVAVEMEEDGRSFSQVLEDLARLNLDPERINVKGARLIDVLHPSAEYSKIERFGVSSKHLPRVIFIDGLNVEGSRQGSFSDVEFSAQVSYKSFARDILEDHSEWQQRIQPELEKLENFIRRKGERIYTYRNVSPVRQ